MRIFRDVGNWHGEVETLASLGGLLRDLGDYVQARVYYEQTLKTGRVRGWMLAGLGLLHHHLGEHEAARERCQQVATHAQSRGGRPGGRPTQASALTCLGHALAGLGRLDETADAYRQALSLQRELDAQTLAMEPLAGLAHVALSQGDLARAQTETEEILVHLDIHPQLEGALEPLRVYLTCYRVLRADGDPRARQILDSAYRLLQERAHKIDDEDLRRSYLENVAAHREIVSEFARGN